MESRNFAIIRATKYSGAAVLEAPRAVIEPARRLDVGNVPPPDPLAQSRARVRDQHGRFAPTPYSKRIQELPSRFWAKVKKDGPVPVHLPDLGKCWVWTAGCYPSGYGVFSVNGSPRGAHRVSYELAKGPVPDGLYVLHACDNPKCVNPDHLFAGSQKDNIQDMHNKGRYRNGAVRGERNPASKLTDDDVRCIRSIYKPYSREFSQRALARRFGVSKKVIELVLSGRAWGHVK